MNQHTIIFEILGKEIRDWQQVAYRYVKPRFGWIRTIRSTLNMTAEQLAERLGVNRRRVTTMEVAEINDSITLRSLKAAAEAMDCEVVYAFIPKNKKTLEDIVNDQAERIADERLKRVAHSMALEDQAVSKKFVARRKKEIVMQLTSHLNKKLWKRNYHEIRISKRSNTSRT